MNIKLSYITSVLVRVLNIGCKGNEVLAVLHLALQQFCHNFCLKIGVESSLPEPYKPSKPRPTSTKSSDTIMPTMNKARSFPTIQTLSEVQNVYRVRGRTELHKWVLTMNENKNPEEGRPTGLRRAR